MLIAHGDSDRNILPQYGKQLYDGLKSKQKEFILVEGAGHFGLFAKAGKAYENQIMNFIKRFQK